MCKIYIKNFENLIRISKFLKGPYVKYFLNNENINEVLKTFFVFFWRGGIKIK